MSTAVDLLIITNGLWGILALAAIWALLHFGKVKVSSPTERGKKTTPAAPDAASQPEASTAALPKVVGM